MRLTIIPATILMLLAVMDAGVHVRAQGASPLNLTVERQSISWDDVTALFTAIYSVRPEIIEKQPSAMPSDAPLVNYFGKDQGPPPKAIIWIVKTPSPQPGNRQDETEARTLGDAYVAAFVLAAMDAGTAGATWQKLYASTPANRAARLALGKAAAEALKSASDQREAGAASQAAWIRTHIIPGTLRSAAYSMLKANDLIAYNPAFIKGKPTQGGRPSLNHPTIGPGCDLSDRSSGAWPYQNEALPRQEGVCAVVSRGVKAMPNPDAFVDLGGSFSVVCAWTIPVTISFGMDDRVTKVEIDKPRLACL